MIRPARLLSLKPRRFAKKSSLLPPWFARKPAELALNTPPGDRACLIQNSKKIQQPIRLHLLRNPLLIVVRSARVPVPLTTAISSTYMPTEMPVFNATRTVLCIAVIALSASQGYQNGLHYTIDTRVVELESRPDVMQVQLLYSEANERNSAPTPGWLHTPRDPQLFPGGHHINLDVRTTKDTGNCWPRLKLVLYKYRTAPSVVSTQCHT